MLAIKIWVCVVWVLGAMFLGLIGKVTLGKKQLPPSVGMLAAPLYLLLMGVVCAVVAITFTAPVWIWMVRR